MAASSKSPHVREVVADAISKLPPLLKQQFFPLLERLAHDPDTNVKWAASEALQQ
jgi:HEAT repeat protein